MGNPVPHRRICLAKLCGVIALACGVLFADCGRTFDGMSDPAVALVSTQPPTSPLSFERDVIPALTKAGCNAGACHGSFQGRGGLSYSLLGFNSAHDYDVLTKAARGRR